MGAWSLLQIPMLFTDVELGQNCTVLVVVEIKQGIAVIDSLPPLQSALKT